MIVQNVLIATSLMDAWPLDLNMTLLGGAVVFCILIVIFALSRGSQDEERMMRASAQAMGRGGQRPRALPMARSRDRPLVEVNELPGIIWVSESEPLKRKFSQKWTDFTGKSVETANAGKWIDAIHPDDRKDILETIKRRVEAGQPINIVYRLRRADGEYRWTLEVGRPHRDGLATATGMAGVMFDIHERHQEVIEHRETTSQLTEQNHRLEVQVNELEERRAELESELRTLRLKTASRGGVGSLAAAMGEDVEDVGDQGDGEERPRRVHARLPIEGLTCSAGEVINLSLGGIGIRMAKVPEEVIDIELEDDEGALRVKAEPMWSKKDGRRKFEVGFRFLNLSDQAARRVTALATLHRYRRVMDQAG